MKAVILWAAIFLFYGQSFSIPVSTSATTIVARFGSAYCPWSKALREEIWNSPSFQALLDRAGIERKEDDGQGLQDHVPVLILFAPDKREIGRLGYILVPSEKYVELFQEMISIYTLCQMPSVLEVGQLLDLYRKCQLLHMTSSEVTLLEEGIMRDQGVEFLIEKYAKIIGQHPRQAHKIKQEIRTRKPNDILTEWELALISFQSRREKMTDHLPIVRPLEKFLLRFGAQNEEYNWKCHLVLAQFYRDEHQLEKARFHAHQTTQKCPEELREIIEK